MPFITRKRAWQSATIAILTFGLATSALGDSGDDDIRDTAIADARQRITILEHKLSAGKSEGLSANTQLAYQKYLADYYKQESDAREQRLEVYRWQIFASNIVLFLVSILTLAGIIYSGIQLNIASSIAKRSIQKAQSGEGNGVVPDRGGPDSSNDSDNSGSIDLEISAQKVRVQTSVVGIAVLVVSGFFLSMFLRDVYKINPVTDCVMDSKIIEAK